MKNINELMRPGSQVKKPMGSDELTRQEIDSVAYFFARVKMIDPMFYDLAMPDSTTEAIVKREHAVFVKDLTRDAMDIGFASLHALRQQGEPDYKYLTLDKIIGVICDSSTKPAGIYKYFKPAGIEDKTKREKDREIAKQEIEKIKSILD